MLDVMRPSLVESVLLNAHQLQRHMWHLWTRLFFIACACGGRGLTTAVQSHIVASLVAGQHWDRLLSLLQILDTSRQHMRHELGLQLLLRQMLP